MHTRAKGGEFMKRKAMAKKTQNNKKASTPKVQKVRFVKKDLEHFREKLLNLKDDILTQIRDTSRDTIMKTQKEISGDMSGYGLHIADAASDHYERDFNLDLVSGERKTVLEIDAALKRINEGTYGICPLCHKAISKVRLNAIPYALYSKECQEKLERENKI
jgi:RNA polymerase-binding protein DksA